MKGANNILLLWNMWICNHSYLYYLACPTGVIFSVEHLFFYLSLLTDLKVIFEESSLFSQGYYLDEWLVFALSQVTQRLQINCPYHAGCGLKWMWWSLTMILVKFLILRNSTSHQSALIQVISQTAFWAISFRDRK